MIVSKGKGFQSIISSHMNARRVSNRNVCDSSFMRLSPHQASKSHSCALLSESFGSVSCRSFVSFLQDVVHDGILHRGQRKHVKAFVTIKALSAKIPPVTIIKHQDRAPHSTLGDHMLVRERQGGRRERMSVQDEEWAHRKGKDGTEGEDAGLEKPLKQDNVLTVVQF